MKDPKALELYEDLKTKAVALSRSAEAFHEHTSEDAGAMIFSLCAGVGGLLHAPDLWPSCLPAMAMAVVDVVRDGKLEMERALAREIAQAN